MKTTLATAHLTGDYLKFEVATDDFENLPQQGSPVYLELDYQSNHTTYWCIYKQPYKCNK